MMFAAMLCKKVFHWNANWRQQLIRTSQCMFFTSLLDALLLWKIVMMCEVSQPLSPKIGLSVCDWGVVMVHKPESQAAVCILDGARFRVMTTVWVDVCISTAAYSWKIPPKRTLRDDLNISWNELAMLFNGSKVLFQEPKCRFGILTWYCWKGTKVSFLVLGGWVICVHQGCILYLKWYASQCRFSSLVLQWSKAFPQNTNLIWEDLITLVSL